MGIYSGYAKYVRLGDLALDSQDDDAHVVQLKIIDTIQPPEFKLLTIYQDIALLKLEHPVTFNQYIRPACLPEYPTPQTDVPLETGWKSGNKLRKKTIDILSYQECNAIYTNENISALVTIDEEKHLCARSRNGSTVVCLFLDFFPCEFEIFI